MKRMKLWLCCGLLVALLGGCGADAKKPDDSWKVQSPEQDISGENQETSDNAENGDEVVPTDIPEVHYEPLPEHWKSVDEQGILWQIPNSEVEEIGLCELICVGENAYICRDRWSAFELTKMNLSDGSILAETVVDLEEWGKVQTLESGLALCCSQNGKIVILDTNLEEVAQYQTEATKGTWFISSDGSVLYDFHYEGTLSACDMITGEKEILLQDMMNCCIMGQDEKYVNFYYIDSVQHKIKHRSLNLKTGQVENVPFEEDFYKLYRKDEVWLGDIYSQEGSHFFCDKDNRIYLILNSTYSDYESRWEMSLTKSQNHILTVTGAGKRMILHDYQGKFISECQLPKDYDVKFNEGKDNCLIWDPIHGGYFFLCDYTPEVNTYQRIFFWDIHAKVDGDDLVMEVVDYDTSEPVGKIVDAQLYKRAKELSEKYHLDIRIAELAYSAFEGYFGLHGQEILDEEKITEELDLIEAIMEQYGPDYMEEKILYAAYGTVEIHLLKELELVWGAQEAGPIEVYTDKINFELDTMQRGRLILYIDVEHATEEDYKEAFYRLEQSKENWEYNYGR